MEIIRGMMLKMMMIKMILTDGAKGDIKTLEPA